MSATTTRNEIEVDAVDGAAAVELERRLWHLTPTTVGRGKTWIVEIPAPANADEVEAVVRDWLADVGQSEATMRVGGRVLHIQPRRPRSPMRPASHIDFIG